MTKDELREFRWIKKNIDRLEAKLLELETEATKVTTRLTKEPKGSRKTNDLMGEIISDIVETQDEINRQLKMFYERMKKIENAISSLTPCEAYLIRLRYLDLKKWESICVDMNYSWMQVHRIHADALKKLAEQKDDTF